MNPDAYPSHRATLCLIFALLVLLLSLIPLLALGPFDVPSADDYTYGAAAHRAYTESGSVSAAVRAAAGQTAETYRTWQGSFSAVFLMALQPAVFGERLYALTPLLILTSLLLGSFCLCLAVFTDLFGLPRALSGCVGALCSLLCIQLLPSPVQGFYWYNGAVYYSFFHGLALASVALAIRLLRRGGAGRSLLLCLLALFLGGGNYVTALSLSIVAFAALALLLLMRDRAWLRLLPALFCLLLSFSFSILAPGNAVRQADVAHTPQALGAILASFAAGARYLVRWFSLPVLGVLLLLPPLLWKPLRHSEFSFRLPGLFSIFSYCLFSAMFCPTFYALGDVGDSRLLNILYDAYVLLLILNMGYWLGWLVRRLPDSAPGGRSLLLACLLCLGCLGVHLHFGGYSSLMALGALRSGDAAAYRNCAVKRLEQLHDKRIADAVLDPYPVKPYVLFFDDFTEDPEDWRNQGGSAYYGKNSLIVRPEGDGKELSWTID